MAEYLIYFHQQWVPNYPEADFAEIGADAQAVCTEMKDAGVLVFACGLEEAPPLAHADATSGELVVADGPYSTPSEWIGGFTIVDVATEDDARRWAGAIAVACRWPQEVRAIGAGSLRG